MGLLAKAILCFLMIHLSLSSGSGNEQGNETNVEGNGIMVSINRRSLARGGGGRSFTSPSSSSSSSSSSGGRSFTSPSSSSSSSFSSGMGWLLK
ncbi:hypothetical protein MKW94_016700 [Papaver nudicaule]|uniref:Uncharacterized protein n=1 Tax=Papaver nudicaule TaxID=74823 RepID=A0AA41S7S5_PAPNU|nr:hypothetical protein [Papaver nudicaule]